MVWANNKVRKKKKKNQEPKGRIRSEGGTMQPSDSACPPSPRCVIFPSQVECLWMSGRESGWRVGTRRWKMGPAWVQRQRPNCGSPQSGFYLSQGPPRDHMVTARGYSPTGTCFTYRTENNCRSKKKDSILAFFGSLSQRQGPLSNNQADNLVNGNLWK